MKKGIEEILTVVLVALQEVPKRADRRVDRVPSACYFLWSVHLPFVKSMMLTQLIKAQVLEGMLFFFFLQKTTADFFRFFPKANMRLRAMHERATNAKDLRCVA